MPLADRTETATATARSGAALYRLFVLPGLHTCIKRLREIHDGMLNPGPNLTVGMATAPSICNDDDEQLLHSIHRDDSFPWGRMGEGFE